VTTTDSTEPNEDGTRDLEREIDDVRADDRGELPLVSDRPRLEEWMKRTRGHPVC